MHKKQNIIVNGILITTLCIAITVIFVYVRKIMPLYASWQYANKTMTLDLPVTSEPKLVTIELQYGNKPPSDVKIKLENKTIIKTVQELDENNKILKISYDDNNFDKQHILTLTPQDNYELTYKIITNPSISHTSNNIKCYKNQNGDFWLAINGKYDTMDSVDVKLIVQATGKANNTEFKPILFDTTLPKDTVNINISEILRAKKINPDTLTKISINMNAEISRIDYPELYDKIMLYQDKNIENSTYYTYTNYNLKLSDWPDYNKDENNIYDMSKTTEYLELKDPNYKK